MAAHETSRGLGDHQLFVGADDPDLDRPLVGRDQEGAGCVSAFVQGDPEESQALTNAAADLGRVLTDPAGEHQGVQPAQRGGEGADPLLRLVAKQLDCLGRPDIGILPCQEIAHVGAGFRDPEQAGLVVHEAVELVGRHSLGPRQEPNQARIEVARARPHDQPGGRREAHGRVDGMATPDRRQARPGAQVRQDDAAPGFLRAGDPGQFLHQIRIRQAMEAIAPYPGGLEPPRDRHDLGHAGHVVMKRGVEARNLG